MNNDEIEQEVLKFGWINRMVVRSGVKGMLERLHEGEKVLSIAMASTAGGEFDGTLFCTTRRIAFVAFKGFKSTFKEYKLNGSTSIQTESGFFEGSLKINSYGNRAKFIGIRSAQLDTLEAAIESVRSGVNKNRNKGDSDPRRKDRDKMSSSNLVSEIERLAELHSTGMLTNDEFTSAKKKIIG